MSTEHTQADEVITAIEQASIQRARRLGEEAALTQQVADLEAVIRNLYNKLAESRSAIESQTEHAKTLRGTIEQQRAAIDMLNGTVRRQREQIRRQWEELHEAGLMRGEDDRHEIRGEAARFARSTGAADALRGAL